MNLIPTYIDVLKKSNILQKLGPFNELKFHKMGGQNEVYKVDVYKTDILLKKIILKLYTNDNGEMNCKSEFELLKVLKELMFPVPQVICHECNGNLFGKPFIIMNYIDGDTINQAIRGLTPKETYLIFKRHVKMILKLHELDVIKYFSKNEISMELYLEHLIKQCIYRAKNLASFCLDHTKIIEWFIIKRREIIPSLRLSLVHCDLNFNNCIITDHGQMVFLDWADARFHDYRIELGLLLLNGYIPIYSIYQMLTRKKQLNIEFFVAYLALRIVFDYFHQKPIESKVFNNSRNVLIDLIGVKIPAV